MNWALKWRAIAVAGAMAAPSACATAYAPALARGDSARVEIAPAPMPGTKGIGNLPKHFSVDVHDFADGCPAVKLTRRGKGYRGTIDAKFDTVTAADVPAGRRIVLTSVWHTAASPFSPAGVLPAVAIGVSTLCYAVITFIPERGSTYVVRYVSPDRSKAACGATAEKIVTGRDGATSAVQPEGLAYPHDVDGAAAFQRGGLCTFAP